jgi:AIPR protein
MEMQNNETVLVDGYIQAAQDERDTPLEDDVAFETFGAQMVLRDRNLSDEEIELGRVGGGMDGAIDGVYVFLDGELLDEDSELFDPGFKVRAIRKNPELTLWLIQSKRTPSFTETAFDLVHSSVSRLLDLNQTDDQLRVLYSDELISRIRIFTKAWILLSTRSPSISLRFDYVTRGDVSTVGAPVQQKAEDLKSLLESKVPGAAANVRMIGARELWTIANNVPEYDLQLRFAEYLSKGPSYTGLVSLADYYEFLSDDKGELRGHLFDWNVRDFQGGVSVNKDIQSTLDSGDALDFWWLNNGVTILCSTVSISGDKLFTMENVQIVNGMQTSHSVHSAIRRIGVEAERARQRSLLVRVFQTQDEATRDRIIRATNSQTKVPDASLHATEDIHRQLEVYFAAKGWFYDRRKNFYKNNGKPADRIVSIPALGQATMAMGLGRPDDARARPSSLLNNPNDYKSIFSQKVPLATYLWLAQAQRRIDSILLMPDVADAYVRTNLRFYVSVYLVTKQLGARVYSPSQLAAVAGTPVDFSREDVEQALELLTTDAGELFERHGWTLDRVAKSDSFAEITINRALGIEPSFGDDESILSDEDVATGPFGPGSDFDEAMENDD